jgi:hypothetical protein
VFVDCGRPGIGVDGGGDRAGVGGAVGGRVDVGDHAEPAVWRRGGGVGLRGAGPRGGARRTPAGQEEERAAERIVDLLGCHPLAVDVAGSYLAGGYETFAGYARALEDPAREDAVEWGAALEESLPTGHEKSISATLVKSLRQLGEEGLDFLRLAAVVAAAPIPRSLVEGVWGRIGAGGGSGRGWVAGVCCKHSVSAFRRSSRWSLARFKRSVRTTCARIEAWLSVLDYI